MEGLNVLFVNIRDDRLDSNLSIDVLVDEARPHGQILLLKLDEVSALCICCDFRVDELGIFDATAVEVVLVGDNQHLVLDEYEREIPTPPTPTLWKGRRLRNLRVLFVIVEQCGSLRCSPS